MPKAARPKPLRRIRRGAGRSPVATVVAHAEAGTVKRSVTIEKSVLEGIASFGIENVSGFLNDAAKLKLHQMGVAGALDELDRRFGPVSDDVMGATAERLRKAKQAYRDRAR